MNPERDTTRIVRSWLKDGATGVSDRVLDNVLDQLPATPQRRHLWQARRSPRLTNAYRLAMAAAAVVLVGAIGLNLVPGSAQPGVGAAATPSPTATPTPSPTPSATPTPTPSPALTPTPSGAGAGSVALPDGPLAAGRYHLDVPISAYPSGSDPVVVGAARVTFELPAGWLGVPTGEPDVGWAVTKGGAGYELAMAPWVIGSLNLDPCNWVGALGRGEVVGRPEVESVAGLADAIDASWGADPGFGPTSPTATKATDVTLAGRSGRYVTVRTPADLDFATCDGYQYTLWDDANGGSRYSHRPGELNRLWIIGLGGSDPAAQSAPLVIDAASQPGNSAEDLAELQAIIDSIEIELLPSP